MWNKIIMKKRIVLLLINIIIFNYGFSQDLGVNAGGHGYAGLNTGAANYISNFDSNLKKQLDQNYKNLVGSVYINDEFSKAKLSSHESFFEIRYDAYSDEMEMKTPEDIRYLLKTPKLEIRFPDSDKTYGLYSNSNTSENKEGFFVIILKGDKFSLLLKEKVIFTDEFVPKTGYEKYVAPTLKRTEDKFYIGYKNNMANELPSRKNDVLSLFSGKSKDVKKYAKTNKLSFSKKDDLIKIFTYYNSLK